MPRQERRAAKLKARINDMLDSDSKSQPLSGPEVDVFFADSSGQRKPSRPGIGPLVAIGGLNVAVEEVRDIGQELDQICANAGFPPNQEFKWSPGRELWMWDNLASGKRQNFFIGVLRVLKEKEVVAFVVIADTTCGSATGARSPEVDVTTMFLERVEQQCERNRSEGFVVVDRPSGDRRDEDAFLLDCLETLQSGTKFVKPTRIIHNVVSTPSKLSRLLQAADLVTGCTLAAVSGETEHAPVVFNEIRPMLDQNMGRTGGYGLKFHPDFKYANLYHWLADDTHFWKSGSGHPMPLPGYPYSEDPFVL